MSTMEHVPPKVTGRWDAIDVEKIDKWLDEFYAIYPEVLDWKAVFRRFFVTYLEMIQRCRTRKAGGFGRTSDFTHGMVDRPFYMDPLDSMEFTTMSTGNYRKYLDFPDFQRKSIYMSGPSSPAHPSKSGLRNKGPVECVYYRHKSRAWYCLSIYGVDFLLFSTKGRLSRVKMLLRYEEVLKEMYCFETLVT